MKGSVGTATTLHGISYQFKVKRPGQRFFCTRCKTQMEIGHWGWVSFGTAKHFNCQRPDQKPVKRKRRKR